MKKILSLLFITLLCSLALFILNIPYQWIFDESNPSFKIIILNSLQLSLFSYPVFFLLAVLNSNFRYESKLGQLELENKALRKLYKFYSGNDFMPPKTSVTKEAIESYTDKLLTPHN